MADSLLSILVNNSAIFSKSFIGKPPFLGISNSYTSLKSDRPPKFESPYHGTQLKSKLWTETNGRGSGLI